MSTIYLHIGLPKTGTTSVQFFLWQNKTELEKHDLCYPDFGFHYPAIPSSRNAHFLISRFVDNTDKRSKMPDPDNYDSILDQLAEYGKRFGRILLSDESIWRYWAEQPELWKKLKCDLEQRNLKLHIIVYLRRQDNFILSVYRQRVKGAFTSDRFYDFMDTLKKNYPVDFLSYLDMLSDCVGKENLIIRIYENEQYHGGSLISDFLDIFGLSMQDNFNVERERYNPSLDDSLFELRRTLNLLPKPLRRNPVFNKSIKELLLENPLNTGHEKTSFFRPGEQRIYLESFSESNSRLAKKYLGREDGKLFLNNSDVELPPYQVDTESLLQNVILFYAKVTDRLQQQNDMLQNKLEQQNEEFHAELKELHTELKKVRESVILYRLKRKFRSLFGKDCM